MLPAAAGGRVRHGRPEDGGAQERAEKGCAGARSGKAGERLRPTGCQPSRCNGKKRGCATKVSKKHGKGLSRNQYIGPT